MAREISRAEAWERAHTIFSQVNFNAFDFNTIKESLLDYVKLYYPEDFNDYIESSEFIAVLELFAYIGELLAYRVDLNAHENFITTAERKDSILRLAKLISYKASRNIPARGLVKMTSIQTTETVFDSNGVNLAGRRIYWNDSNNPDWKEQFLIVINRILEQEFGSVEPSERTQVDDVLFELYTMENNPITTNGRSVISYNATAGTGDTVPMELVPTQLTASGPTERRPESNAKFSLLYSNDGLGDGSDTTGFLMYTKQGTLNLLTTTFDGVTPNQTFKVEVDNINETDVFVNNIDPNTRAILVTDPFADVFPHLVSDDLRYGEWVEVDIANAQNIIFNTNRNRNKYEIETLDNDQISLIFGDGEFSNIPSGTFQIWYRTSANEDLFIERSTVIDKTATLSYNDVTGSVQTISFTFSLVNSLQNASASEDIDHIRRVAPSVYYTQDRMVNGRDYNTFMLQDPSILRMRSINRTYAGDSKYIAWNDPRENYENVKIFGDDLALYWDEETPTNGQLLVVNGSVGAEDLLDTYVQPILSSSDFFAKIGPELQLLGRDPGSIRRTFNGELNPYVLPVDGETDERSAIIAALEDAATNSTVVYLFYSPTYDEWTVGADTTTSNHPCDPEAVGCALGDATPIWMYTIEPRFTGSSLSGWDIRWRTRRLIANSQSTQFWNSNDTSSVVEYDTLNSVNDTVVVLEANKNANGTGLLTANKDYKIIAQELVDQNLPDAGLIDTSSLSVLPPDENADGISDDLLQTDIFDGNFEYTWLSDTSMLSPGSSPSPYLGNEFNDVEEGQSRPVIDIEAQFNRKINNSTTRGLDVDVEVYVNGERYTFADGDLYIPDEDVEDGTPLVANTIGFTGTKPFPTVGDIVQFVFKDYVYFTRDDALSAWYPVSASDSLRTLFLTESADNEDEERYKREEGRYPLNFAWFHYTPRFNLIDPAASNIIDMYIVTTGYYNNLRAWLANRTSIEPAQPTPLDLRASYANLLENKMISDTVVLHPGRFKILFGSRAIPELRCKFKVIRPTASTLTDNQVKAQIVTLIRQFHDIDSWEFGETFYFTELAASIHSALGPEIDSVVLVPLFAQNQFGDMFQVQAREDELFIPDISTTDIEIVLSLTSENLRQEPS